MTREQLRRQLDALHATADYCRLRYDRAYRAVDEDEHARQLAHLHGQISRLYRRLAPQPRRDGDWRDG